MSDRIRLDGLRVFARHGVLPGEASVGQVFVVDVELELDLTTAGRTDDLVATIDYGGLANEVTDVVAHERWNLIERVAERVAETALAHDMVQVVTVVVHKPGAPISVAFSDVSVTVRRDRN